MARWTRPSGLKASSPVGVLRFSGVCFVLSLSFFFPFEKGLANQKRAQKRRKEEAFLFFLFCLFLFQENKEREQGKPLTLGNSTTELTPSARASLTALRRPVFQPSLDTPGIESMGMSSSPSWMKTGRSRLAGVKMVSVMALRMVGERRLRRGREGRSCGVCRDSEWG